MPILDKNLTPVIHRKQCNYENLCEKFKPPADTLYKQYFHLYLTRLSTVKDRLRERIQLKWGSEYPVCRLGDICNQSGLCIVTGTLFKDQQLKPSILKELSEENQLIPQPTRTHFTAESDVLILEDDMQRISLVGGIKVNDVVTGVPCAILGCDIELGEFRVEDYTFLDCPEQIERPLLTEDKYVILLSGLDIANKEISLFCTELLIDFVTGLVGDVSQGEAISKVCRVIIAGNSIRSCQDSTTKKSLISKNVQTEDTFEAVKLFDRFLARLVSVVQVDLLPGEFDPTNHMLPQQPLHYCLFPESNKYTTLNGVTNPYDCKIDGFRFMGSSGQPVHDIGRYSTIENPIEALQRCVVWSHLCPTAPDTLSCYPYCDKDPFVIAECPHVIFAGNQPTFQKKIYKGPEKQEVLLISIPEYHKTHTVVLLNLKNFDCQPITFKI